MSRVVILGFGVLTIGGALFFGLVYSSSMERQIKVLCCVSLIMAGAMWWSWVVQRLASMSFEVKLWRAVLNYSVARRDADSPIEETSLLREAIERGAMPFDPKGERRYFWYFFGMVVFWFIGGSIVAGFLP